MGKRLFAHKVFAIFIFAMIFGLSAKAQVPVSCLRYNAQICQAQRQLLQMNFESSLVSGAEVNIAGLYLVLGIMEIEDSELNPQIVSSAGAIGLLQIKPATALLDFQLLGEHGISLNLPNGVQTPSSESLTDPTTNIFWATADLMRQWTRVQSLINSDVYTSCRKTWTSWDHYQMLAAFYHLGTAKIDPSSCQIVSSEARDYADRAVNFIRSDLDPDYEPTCGFKTVEDFCSAHE